MSVSNTDNRSPASGGYTCNDSVVDFSGTFRILAAADVAVVLTDPNGDDTTLTLTNDYTVAPTGGSYPADSFTVTTVATYDVGNKIVLLRDMTITQPTGYGNQGPYLPKNHENSYDRLTLIVQQLSELIERCLTLSPSSTDTTDAEAFLAACRAAQAAAEAALAQFTSLMTLNNQAGTAYTVLASDAGNVVRMTSASPNTVTIDTYANENIEVGATIVIKRAGAGSTSITAATGVTLNGVSGGTGVMMFQYADVMLQNVGTNIWEVGGAISTVS